ncbi:ribokinase [Ramlibacter rhizophilus]|uniref:Ribokinase n=1 Tax=Ramlibacter rhizophilus TaxID=1781167 RepID=A0A4Z0BDY3_9BURK|nr:ribokinase [Ramlibacter rhizophilus]TFY97535.1 ribokinase [Ramlibacter rhizophilus]
MHSRSQPSAAGVVLSVGSINADFQFRVERRPEISETLVGHDFVRLGGGKAANVALLAARLGRVARLFGHVGDDELAEQALAPLRSEGVDLAGVRRVPGQATGVAMITVPPDGAKGIVLSLNANDAVWNEADRETLSHAIAAAPAHSVLVADGEMDADGLQLALSKARAAGIRTVLDPSPAERIDDRALALADYVVPNPGEAGRLTDVEVEGVDSAIAAGRRLLARGAGAACMKLSDGGCVLVRGEGVTCIEPLGVEVVDTTGAGDAFAGGLAVGLARGETEADALRLAVAASQCAVTGYGSQPAYPRWDALVALARRLTLGPHVER